MELIRFEVNIPQIVTLAFSEGKPVHSDKFDKDELFFSTVDGHGFYTPPIVGAKLREQGVVARQQIELCKKQVGRSIEWQVRTHNAAKAADTFLENVPAVVTPKQTAPSAYPAPAPALTQQRPVVLRMMASLCAAVDAAMEAEIYGARQGRDFTFSEESLRAIALTVFIQDSKGGAA